MSLIRRTNESIKLVEKALDAKYALVSADDKVELADAKVALADLKTAIADLKEENGQLREHVKLKQEYVLDRTVYWIKDDKDKKQPYCSVCYSKDLLVPLLKTWEGRRKEETPWHCPDKKCGASFNPWDHEEERLAPRSGGDFIY